MADVVQDVKDRIDIVTLTSQYLQLKKAGRNYKACCPFHSEKSASFVVSPEKQIFHCFGCHKGGDVFTFLQEIEGIEFTEALNILADRAGVKVEKKTIKQSKASKDFKEKFFEAHEIALKFFEDQLHNTAEGKKVLSYLEKRGLNEESIKEFRLGFGPDSYDQLHTYMLKKGVSKDILIQSGLVSTKNVGDSNIYDKYRARLVFPIFDYLGRVCGFAARALKKDQAPKYLNSPENPVYNKSKVLYGLSHAKQTIKEKDSVILVEGYFDMILPYQVGVKNVVATSGTALTPDHVKVLKRLTSNVIAYFDTDNAGFEATKRGYSLLQDQEMFMKMVDVGQNLKDPADYVKEHGISVADLIGEAKDFINVYINRLVSKNDKSSTQDMRKIFQEILPLFKKMLPGNRDRYVRELARNLDVNERTVYDEIDHYKLPDSHPARRLAEQEPVTESVKKIGLEELVCGILIENPQMFKKIAEELAIDDFDGEMKEVYKGLLDQYNASRDELDNWNFEAAHLSAAKEKLDFLSLYIEERYQSITGEALIVELSQLIQKMKKQRKAKHLNNIQFQITEAEKAQDKQKLLELLALQQEILNS